MTITDPYPVTAVANWFLDKAKAEGTSIDPLKLQKIIYFAHGWNLALRGFPLIDEEFEAWPYGPVVPALYHAFKHFGSRPITEPAKLFDIVPEISAEEDQGTVRFLERVWNTFGRKSGTELSRLTHAAHSPWTETNAKNPKIHSPGIPNELIERYFADLRDRQRGQQ